MSLAPAAAARARMRSTVRTAVSSVAGSNTSSSRSVLLRHREMLARNPLGQRVHRCRRDGVVVQPRGRDAELKAQRAENRVGRGESEIEELLTEAAIRSPLMIDRDRQLFLRDQLPVEENLSER